MHGVIFGKKFLTSSFQMYRQNCCCVAAENIHTLPNEDHQKFLHMLRPVLGASFASFLVSQPYYSTNHLFQTFCPGYYT